MINFKNKQDLENMTLIHPIVWMIFGDMAAYAQLHHNVDLTVTASKSTVEIDEELGRTSPSHREGRAIDIRSKDIDVWKLQDILRYINNKKEYKKYHYMSSSGIMRLAYLHVGTAAHIHLSIHSQFKVKK